MADLVIEDEIVRSRPSHWRSYLFGLVVSLVLIIVGFLIVVPRLGPVGIAWVVVMVLIACVHLFNLVVHPFDS